MLGSAGIALVFSFVAAMLEHPVRRHVVPSGNRLYDGTLDWLRFPQALFPRTPPR
jgi:hypothetical protein